MGSRFFGLMIKKAITITVAAVLSGLAGDVPGQEAQKDVLLEVVQTTNDIHRSETLGYVRIRSDGRGEAHSTQSVDFRNIDLKRKTISPEELNELRGILNDKSTGNLDSHYDRLWGAKDFRIEWQVTLLEDGNTRSINLVNFQPFLARRKHEDYPRQLERLGCMIWLLRTEVTGEGLERNYLEGCGSLGFPGARKENASR
jgi:hypothetical protein